MKLNSELNVNSSLGSNTAEADTYFFNVSTSSSAVPHEKVPLLMTIESTDNTKQQYIIHNMTLSSTTATSVYVYMLLFSSYLEVS